MKSPAASSSLLLLALAVVVMAQFAHSAVWIEKVIENPMYPRHCKDRGLNKYFAHDSSWYDNASCLKMTCQFPYIRTFSCSPVGIDPPCTLVTDNSKNYPECCPQPQCPSLDEMPGDVNTI